MLEYNIGPYKKQDGDIILDNFHPIYPNQLNQDNQFVLFDDNKLDKEAIEFMKASPLRFKVAAKDKAMIRGMRSSKTMKITEEEKLDLNPFQLALDMVTILDREFLAGFLLEHKPSLFVPIKHLSCNLNKFSESNKKAIMWLDINLFRVDYSILARFIAHYIKPEALGRFDLKWKYPKKTDETDKSED